MNNLVANNAFVPANIEEAMRLSDILSKSQLVPKQYQNKAEDVLVATMWGRELGLAPMQALQNIAVINGRPSVYGDAAMALVQASPHCEDIAETLEGDGTPNPVAVCTAKRKGRAAVVARFSVDDAKRAGLWGKAGPWTQYPKRMLQMRARGFALRDAFPDVLKGLVTIEEAQDTPVDVTPERSQPQAVTFVPPVIDMETGEIGKEPQHEYALYLPDGNVYSSYETDSAWTEGYIEMIRKITSSTKLSDGAKMTKVTELEKANKTIRHGLRPALVAKITLVMPREPGSDDDES